MQAPQVVLLVLFVLASLHVESAVLRGIIERAGFLGTVAAGASYEWTPQHATDITLGTFSVGNNSYSQTNLAYRYSRWSSDVDGNTWQPFQMGMFLVYANNKEKFFLDSPNKYPSKGYYDQTAFRYGAEIGSTYTLTTSHLAFAYRLRILDSGLVAAFNNSNRDLQYYVSSGFSIQYVF